MKAPNLPERSVLALLSEAAKRDLKPHEAASMLDPSLNHKQLLRALEKYATKGLVTFTWSPLTTGRLTEAGKQRLAELQEAQA